MVMTPINQGAEAVGDFYMYVNSVLARGGKIFLTKDNLVFQPTNFLDKALGAKEVAIELNGITKTNIQGVLAKNLLVLDNDRIYKFFGSDLENFLQALQKAIDKAQVKET